MGNTIYGDAKRSTPLTPSEFGLLCEHMQRHAQWNGQDWNEPYRLKIILNAVTQTTDISVMLKIGYNADEIEAFLTTLTELRSLLPDSEFTVSDDLDLVRWSGQAYQLGVDTIVTPRDGNAAQPNPPCASAEAQPSTSEKVFVTNIKRDASLMYYIREGNVWATSRQRGGERSMVAETNLIIDHATYLYFVDQDGDVSRTRRQVTS